MHQLYEVELSEPAERVYLQLHEKAQACLDAGHDDHSEVRTFQAVETAIEATLASSPCIPGRTLAGMLNNVYRLPLCGAAITYVILESKSTVLVMTISAAPQNHAIRQWLNCAIDTGQVDGLLARLGIDNPCAKVHVGSRLLH